MQIYNISNLMKMVMGSSIKPMRLKGMFEDFEVLFIVVFYDLYFIYKYLKSVI